MFFVVSRLRSIPALTTCATLTRITSIRQLRSFKYLFGVRHSIPWRKILSGHALYHQRWTMKLRSASVRVQSSKGETDIKHAVSPKEKCGLVIAISTDGVKGRKFLHIIPTVALLLAGTALMLTHHFFYAYLDSKIIDPTASELPSILRDQRTPNIIGTIIAHGACAVFSMIVNSTFAQLFWEKLKTRSYSLQQIDALVKSGRGPFHSSMSRTMATAPSLLFVSLLAASMSLVVVFSPGSLTVDPASQHLGPCLVPTATNLNSYDNLDMGFGPQDILSTGTYIPPWRGDFCAKGASSCSYNISFAGAVLRCLDVTNQTDFASSLNSFTGDTNNDSPYLIWNGTSRWDPDGSSMKLLVSTWDLENNVKQANNCSAYQATYTAEVTQNARSVEARAVDIAVDPVSAMQGSLMADMQIFIANSIGFLSGVVFAGPNGILQESPLLLSADGSLSHSRIFVTTPTGNHTWSDKNISSILTSLMQNVSLSLLSGSAQQKPQFFQTSCISTWNAYAYTPNRLLLTYGTALACAILIAVPGISLIFRNGVEEMFVFSHTIKSALNPQWPQLSTDLKNGTTHGQDPMDPRDDDTARRSSIKCERQEWVGSTKRRSAPPPNPHNKNTVKRK
ncbi:hypothetical protein SCHPADRAFT_320659 [Schizopora paradoxa]|uniref:Uncharacterized protein n=1 Tax=Schizopora paradoxa TaxID=27342 RepID=A0A0H2SBT2_9AGAM|nr:hypothetical protein SCHPADRAFT_320659 [Schizopora paradoxa]